MTQQYQNSKTLLEVHGLRKVFGETVVLRGLDFTVAKGERIALMGPSGSGKSTLLNCLGGIERPDQGEVLLSGNELTSLSADELACLRRCTIGTVFQFFHLLPTLTVRENIAFPMELAGWSQAKIKKQLGQLLEEVKIGHRAGAYPETLSGGEQQRVAVARSLAVGPSLLLADEPTGNLDRKTGDTVLNLMEQLSEKHNVAMVMVTHDERSTRICHRILRLEDGVLAGVPEERNEEETAG
ncbi:MAG: ABC transporter ATP-binding protein [Opitutales bacterium]|nr:ABC transporter ATP-binding protein [Opitutales bacterium]MCH8539545.1 ABC transporter ATP-binding protein [Opitutales bacterium]